MFAKIFFYKNQEIFHQRNLNVENQETDFNHVKGHLFTNILISLNKLFNLGSLFIEEYLTIKERQKYELTNLETFDRKSIKIYIKKSSEKKFNKDKKLILNLNYVFDKCFFITDENDEDKALFDQDLAINSNVNLDNFIIASKEAVFNTLKVIDYLFSIDILPSNLDIVGEGNCSIIASEVIAFCRDNYYNILVLSEGKSSFDLCYFPKKIQLFKHKGKKLEM